MNTDLNDTLAFLKVVETGSFTAASRDLRQPKTTISRRIRQLEERLGAQLLHRTTRRLGLTEAGVIYFEHCKTISQTLAEAETAVNHMRGEPRGTLRITSSYTVMLTHISPLLGEFRLLYPEVRIELILSHETLDLVDMQIDIALRLGSLADSSMMSRRLAAFPNRIFASPEYLQMHGSPEHPSELVKHLALVTRVARKGSSYFWPMTNGGALENYEVTPVIEADDPEVLKRPLLAGAGLMMATDQIMQEHLLAGHVQVVLPQWTGRNPSLYAVFPQGEIQPPKLRAFIDFLVLRLKSE